MTKRSQRKEVWYPVRGYRGFYETTKKGKIRSVDRIVETKRGTRFYRGKVLKPQLNNCGYFHYSLSKRGKCKCVKRATIVAHTFIPNPNEYVEVNHKDGNKQNDHVSNLEWVTHLENVRHAFSTGLVKTRGDKRGTSNGRAILNDDIIRDVRRMLAKGLPPARVIRKYPMLNQSKVSKIKLRRQWAHVH